MTKPTTAPYQRHRKETLRGVEHDRVLAVARDLMKYNRRRGKRYKRATDRALQGKSS